MPVKNVGLTHDCERITMRLWRVEKATPAHRKNKLGRMLENAQSVIYAHCTNLPMSRCADARGFMKYL